MASLRIEGASTVITLDKATVESIEYDAATQVMEIYFKSGRRTQVTGCDPELHAACIEGVFGPQPPLNDPRRLVVAPPGDTEKN